MSKLESEEPIEPRKLDPEPRERGMGRIFIISESSKDVGLTVMGSGDEVELKKQSVERSFVLKTVDIDLFDYRRLDGTGYEIYSKDGTYSWICPDRYYHADVTVDMLNDPFRSVVSVVEMDDNQNPRYEIDVVDDDGDYDYTLGAYGSKKNADGIARVINERYALKKAAKGNQP